MFPLRAAPSQIVERVLLAFPRVRLLGDFGALAEPRQRECPMGPALPWDIGSHWLGARLYGLQAPGGPSLVDNRAHVSTENADLREASRP